MEHKLELQIFSDTAKDFDDFLSNEVVDKIVFSGKYGAGKTTFLNCFFTDQKGLGIQDRGYDVFRISPVHYSIASNQDIIDLIKYDVVSQFIAKPHVEIIENDVPIWYLVSDKDASVILENVLSLLTIKGVGLQPIIEKIKTLDKHFKEKRKKLSESLQFSSFLEEIKDTPGVFERDVITRLIENVLSRLIEQGKKPVLLIDDFDRLDPEHIFRVLNVLSAHVDEDLFSHKGFKNKFGFSKVIIVCDHNNIRSLFHTRYGPEADFIGYFDKFYNKAIFEFDVRKRVRAYLRKLLTEMHEDVVNLYQEELFQFDGKQEELFQQTIIYAILSGHFTLRSLLRIKNFNIHVHYKKLYFNLSRKIRNNSYTLFQLLLNLFLFNGAENVLKILEEMYSRGVPIKIDTYTHSLIGTVEADYKAETKNEFSIYTEKSRHSYRLEGNDWKFTGSVFLPGITSNNNQDHTIDLLRHFMNDLSVIIE